MLEEDRLLKSALANVASLFGLSDAQFIQKTLLEKQSFKADFSPKIKNISCTTVPGGTWGWPRDVEFNGPPEESLGRYMSPPRCKTRLLVICPHPSPAAVDGCMLPVRELSPILNRIVAHTDILPDEIYCCYAVPFYPADGKLETPCVTAFKPILLEEISRIKPENILVLGASSLKGLLGAKGIVNNVYGTTSAQYQGIPLYYTVDPFKLVTNPKSILTLKADMMNLIPALGGEALPWDTTQDYKDYRTAKTVQEVESEVARAFMEFASRGGKLPLAVDLEWGNLDGKDGLMHDIVRFVQFSWAPHTATTVVLTNPDLSILGSQDEYTAKIELLKALFEAKGIELCGQNFKVDLLHLYKMGIDCRKNFEFDTMTGYHYLQPQSDKIGLEVISIRYTDLGRYDLALDEYLKGTKMKAHVKMHGYSMIPDDVLVPYSCLRHDSLVQLGDDTWEQIGDLVHRRYDGDVKCLVGGAVVNRKVTNWHRALVKQREWFKVRTPSCRSGRWGLVGPALTPDHKVLTNEGRVMVRDLVPGCHKIATRETSLSDQQKQLILGSLLGDGGFAERNGAAVGLRVGQVSRREDYVLWKVKSLSNALTFSRAAPSGRGAVVYSSTYSAQLTELRDSWERQPPGVNRSRKLVITETLLQALGPTGLAVWYQDDGTFTKDRTARIYCTKLTPDEIATVNTFFGQFGDAVYKKPGFVGFSADATKKFLEHIHPGMHPSFQYKTNLPIEDTPTITTGSDVYYEDIIEVVDAYRGHEGDGARYCLTVDEGNNFLTQVGFVSNCKDVDCVIQAAPRIKAELELNKVEVPYEIAGHMVYTQLDAYNHVVRKADYGIFEPEYCGLPVDIDLMKRLQKLFSEKLDEIRAKIALVVPWEGFNPDSPQLRVFLFGNHYLKQSQKLEGLSFPTLDLTPVKTTGKYPTAWEDLEPDQISVSTPATDNDSISMLLQRYPDHKDVLQLMLDYKSVNQVLKNFLRPPDEREGEQDDDEDEVYSSGWISKVDDDMRIRGTYLQTTETGRFRSIKPNLNNLSSNAELDVRKLFASTSDFFLPEHNWKEADTRALIRKGLLDPRYDIIRSVVRARPGYVIVGADYKAAEIVSLAYISGDEDLKAVVQDKSLDIHAETAIKAFKLDVPEGMNRKAFVKGQYNSLRNSSKTILFGLIYGRGKNAINSQLLAAGISDSTPEKAQGIINDILTAYPGVAEYIKGQHHAVYDPGYAENPFGRRRYFFHSRLNGVVAAQKRESTNFPKLIGWGSKTGLTHRKPPYVCYYCLTKSRDSSGLVTVN